MKWVQCNELLFIKSHNPIEHIQKFKGLRAMYSKPNSTVFPILLSLYLSGFLMNDGPSERGAAPFFYPKLDP